MDLHFRVDWINKYYKGKQTGTLYLGTCPERTLTYLGIALMATVVERVGVLETKVQHIDEKIDGIKHDVKDMHDCLDRTREGLTETLASMRVEATNQHNDLATKISEIEKSKDKLMLYGAIGAAFVAGTGWSGAINFPMIVKFFGL